ncbi:MAG: META domain-containing protein [Actinomycetota bacterium]
MAALVLAACGSDDDDDIATDASGSSDPVDDSSDSLGADDAGSDDASSGAAGGGATRPWIAGTWALESATGPDGPLTLPDRTLELAIAGPDTIGGDAGCNTFGGRIDAPFDGDRDGGDLTLSELFWTEMACEDLDFEGAYLELLTAVNEWELAPPSGLVFRGDGIELVYGIGEPPAELTLEGPTWVFDTIFSGEGVERTVSSTRSDQPEVTAVFSDRTLTLQSTDCEPIEISLDDVPDATDGPLGVVDAATLADGVACDDAESNMVAAVDGVAQATGFQIFDGRLTLIGLPGETISFRAADG